MKMSDILRDLAELLDQQDQNPGHQGNNAVDDNTTQQRMTMVPTDTPGQSKPKADEPEFDDMVPPLQQKHELLKKLAGVPNEYDDAEDNSELDRMKQMAGIVIAGDENEVN